MSIYDKASLVQIPSGYKSGTLYSVVPNTADGDFTVTGDPQGEATRVNKDGLIEMVSADVPRLNYDPTNPQDPHLLLEPTRTNFNTNSENFSSGYSTVGSPVSEENNLTSPNGGKNASRQTIATTGNGYYKLPTTVTSGTDYTVSAFFKYISGSGEVVRFGAAGVNFGGDQQNRINIKTGAVEFTNTGNTVIVEQYPNDWYRISCTKDAISSGIGGFIMYTHQDDMVFGWWGVQFESGSYPSSYIPTTVAVTRTVDTCNIANYANLPTDYPLTVYWKGQVKEFNGFNCAFSIYKDGASGDFLTVSFNTASQILVRRAIGGSEDVDFINYSYSLGDILKIGIKFTSATTFKLFINGSEIYEETSGTSKTWDFNSVLIGQLRIVADTGNRNSCDVLMLFNEELSDAELITLTS